MAIYYDSTSGLRHGKGSLARAGLSINSDNIHEVTSETVSYDPLTQIAFDSGGAEERDGSYFVVWTIEDRNIDEIKEEMKSSLANIRYEKEINGTETADGTKVLTNRESQASTNSIYNALANSVITSTQWKTVTGWVEVTTTEMLPIVTALNEHVSKSFGAEQTVSSAIDAATTVDDLRAINLVADFDSAYSA